MLNPSTADDRNDDPTIRRCISFAKQWGFGSIEVVNLFAYRATDPSELLKCPDPIGDQNDSFILEAQLRSTFTLLAWGTKGALLGRDQLVLDILNGRSNQVFCLEKTKNGFPKHPLYVRNDIEPIPFFYLQEHQSP